MNFESLAFDDTSVLNSKLMELAQERQKVIANNIANAETPGYIRHELDFESELRDVVKNGDRTGLENFNGELIQDNENPVREDGNNVVLPLEMNHMMENSVYYRLLTKAFSTRMNILKSAIVSNR